MNNTESISKSFELIEQFGLFLEKSGYLPSAARVYALLMIWDPSELHFDEIQGLLKLSKGATSKAINNLISLNRIEVFTKNGVRKKFYRVKLKPGKESTKGFIQYLSTMKGHLQRIEQHKAKTKNNGLRFGEEITFLDQLLKHISSLLE